MTIGTKIKKLRDREKMSQETLANKLGIGQTTLCSIENGDTKKIDFLLMDKICDEFKVDFDYFIEKASLKQINNENSTGYLAENQTINISDRLIIQYEERINELKQQLDELKNK